MNNLYWLPVIDGWRERLQALQTDYHNRPDEAWVEAVALANTKLDFVRTNALDQVVQRLFGDKPPTGARGKPFRLALLGSSTLAHLHAAIRVAGLRRGLWLSIYENDYGQYWQELTDPNSALLEFAPNAILFALDAHHLAAGINATLENAQSEQAFAEVCDRISECWRLAKNVFHCPIFHQTTLPVFPVVLGLNEHRLAGSKHNFIAHLNDEMRALADREGVDLLAIDMSALTEGLNAWYEPALWHRSKQEVSPSAAPLYGDLMARLLAAKRGLSAKCLVMDLDNTLWGGVVGEDGVAGLVIGQGSAVGEAFVAFQEYARELSRRGVILAVCSKNDETNALEPFDKHPDMVLRRADIACFAANWQDKPANLRAIAEELNIGLDSLVFVDDNPFERNLVRRELPMVAVPEVGEDPANFPQILADAGYFEGLTITDEDRARSGFYEENRQREQLKTSTTDLDSYLRGLRMELLHRPFDEVGLPRIVQLINKTNQFNLTTRRYSEDDVLAIMRDGKAFGIQLRLADRFGDNGIISIVIGKLQDDADLSIDTWLMSCRVLGRHVEATTLNLIAAKAKALGAKRLIGEYIPTGKNAMVRDHYAKLGFSRLEAANGRERYVLDLASYEPMSTFLAVKEG